MIDPIFGLKYSPTTIFFADAPADLTARCKELINQNYDRKMWIFGQTHGAEPLYLVIGGYYVYRKIAPDGSKLETDPSGAVLRIEGEKCEPVDPVRDFFQSPPPQLSVSKIEELAHDCACAYSRAFGSYEKFRAALRSQHITSAPGPLKKAIAKAPANCQ